MACADRGNHPVVGFTDAAGDTAEWIPSVVAERDGEVRYGFDAVAAAEDPSFTVVRSFKRLLGSADAGPGQPVVVGDDPRLHAKPPALLAQPSRLLAGSSLLHLEQPRLLAEAPALLVEGFARRLAPGVQSPGSHTNCRAATTGQFE